MGKKDSNTEQEILETAEELFLEKGFAMTSTVEIAKKVGCNQALVHYYYRTKEKLFDAIFEKKIKMFATPFLHQIDYGVPFEERLSQLIAAHFDLIKENPKIPFLLINEFITNPKRLTRLGEKVIEIPKSLLKQFDSGLKKEIENGNIREIEPLDLLITIISLNVTLFLAAPIFKTVVKYSDKEFNRIIERRKQENVRIIMNSLKP